VSRALLGQQRLHLAFEDGEARVEADAMLPQEQKKINHGCVV
jgi:hypothetical protein